MILSIFPSIASICIPTKSDFINRSFIRIDDLYIVIVKYTLSIHSTICCLIINFIHFIFIFNLLALVSTIIIIFMFIVFLVDILILIFIVIIIIPTIFISYILNLSIFILNLSIFIFDLSILIFIFSIFIFVSILISDIDFNIQFIAFFYIYNNIYNDNLCTY